MKSLTVTFLTFAGIIFFTSCNSGKNVKQILSKTETRMEVMDKIAGNSIMSNEMIAAMMNNQNGNLAIMDNEAFMLKLTKEYSTMINLSKDNMINPAIINTGIQSGIPFIAMIN